MVIVQRYYAVMADSASVARLDSKRLRVLAHPLRMRLLGLLRFDGPATATALARRLGTNSGQTSYHLRQLADVGLVEDVAERGSGRERWWQAAHRSTSWSSVDFRDDPDDRAADDWLAGHVARTHARWMQNWLDARPEWSAEWLEAADQSDFNLRLTPERARALASQLHEVIERYRDEHDTDPEAERVTVILHSFPHPEPSL
jgi:predicted ArsR family transcriptional regulator